MAASTQDKTAWRSKLGSGSIVDVLHYNGNKWRRAVVTDQNASDVHVLFLDSTSSESQWLLRDSPRVAPPATKIHLKSGATGNTATAANNGSDTRVDSCIDGSRSPLFDDYLIRSGTVVNIADSNRDHRYEARVLIREHDRMLVSYKGWPLTHSEWISFVSHRCGSHEGRLACWRRRLKMGQGVQVGFRKTPNCLGASHWMPGKVASLSKDASGLLQVEVEWTEHGEAKREWRDPNDDFFVQRGPPMPCVGDDGVVTMNRIVDRETITSVLPPTHECGLYRYVATERLADLERENEQARTSIEVLTREVNKTIAMLNNLKAQSARQGRVIESHAHSMAAQLSAIGSGEPSPPANATRARKRTRQG